ncbi:phage terminase small subunit P27 family [Roseibacterium sp. SDUM158016]|uniref:phage terminase small subunit P27 family n=1 Tax=Roseicyclus sediminis TaxID=2980997 RepID=UPI0021D172FF|nr:phage terminase small subunit P27 family [Roseibacterium sp. SDUM158016]MCU4654489.1 phage terminase small subunit P27 family [Roseibacterium sp. SDUM158016]
MRGRKPKPDKTGVKVVGAALPRCPPHLGDVAKAEWRRLAKPMHDAGVLTIADRAAFAAYCQAYARWVEAEEKLKETPMLLKTPSGYVQQSPWLSIANKQLELMGRFMAELGLTPSARSRLKESILKDEGPPRITSIELVPLKPKFEIDGSDDRPGSDIGRPAVRVISSYDD